MVKTELVNFIKIQGVQLIWCKLRGGIIHVKTNKLWKVTWNCNLLTQSKIQGYHSIRMQVSINNFVKSEYYTENLKGLFMKYDNIKRSAKNFYYLCPNSTNNVLHILELVAIAYGVNELLFFSNTFHGITLFQTKPDKSLEISITIFSLFPRLLMENQECL